ncbi:MAG TPA: hypothetical protein VGJ50_31095 [Streptosporangiaceae bacterium]|jgi:hypothetical protein
MDRISPLDDDLSAPTSMTDHGRDAFALVVAMAHGDADSVELIFETYITDAGGETDLLLRMQRLAAALVSVAAMCATTAGSGVSSADEVFALIRHRLRHLGISI